jgi:hypothetical protein
MGVVHFLIVALMWLFGVIFLLTLAVRVLFRGSVAADIQRNLPFASLFLFLVLWGMDTLLF